MEQKRIQVFVGFIGWIALTLQGVCRGDALAPQQAVGEPLVTGKSISPSPQSTQPMGLFPANLVLSPDGRYVIASLLRGNESLWTLRASDGKSVWHSTRPNAPANRPVRNQSDTPTDMPYSSPRAIAGYYMGLVISRDNTVYVSQGGIGRIAVLTLGDDGTMKQIRSIAARPKDFPAGLALDDRGRLYVANNSAGLGDPLKLSGSMSIYDPIAGTECGRYTFSDSHGGTSNFPLAVAALADGSKAFVASERDDSVYVLDTHDATHPNFLANLATGAHPVALLLSRDQKQLFVANSLGDTVSVIDTQGNRVTGDVNLRPEVARDLPGVTPTALALSPDNHTLYVALADMDAIAVVDVAGMKLQGYIPAGWYPSAVAVTPDGNNLLVANAKGTRIRNPNNVPTIRNGRRAGYPFIYDVLVGNVCAIRIPGGDDLRDDTQTVLRNNRLDRLSNPAANPLAGIGLSAGKIKHVIYMIKENRTYDQILGDVAKGNGDPSLTLFGKEITPNTHAIVDRFVLLDNLYVCSEVSADGWVWSTQGMADAYVERNVPYGGGRSYDYEGENNGYNTAGFPANGDDGKPLSSQPEFKNGAPPIPNVGDTGRNIWDAVRDAGISLRNYGFFLSLNQSGAASMGPDNYPTSPGLQPGGHDLAGVTDLDYRRFDLSYADSDAPRLYFDQTQDKNFVPTTGAYGKSRMPSRFSEWNREFQMMLAKDPSGGAVPALMLVRLPRDHTSGGRGGTQKPQAQVADNDYGVGQFVAAISQSPVWNSTVILVIEDDAQSGQDHVDAHRTVGMVISPWIKAHSVDHHFYNTDSMLRTIELLLGLKPLSQNDAVADPIMDWDSSPSNSEPYVAILPDRQVMAMVNPRIDQLKRGDPRLELALQSEKMDFIHADAAPPEQLDEIIWRVVKGPDSKPPLRRGAHSAAKDDDDDN
jgi:YVTN family beta-propeller protein